MKKTDNSLDLAMLSPASRRVLRDFFQFLLLRDQARKPRPDKAINHRFTDLCGRLSREGNAVETQQNLRKEWERS